MAGSSNVPNAKGELAKGVDKATFSIVNRVVFASLLMALLGFGFGGWAAVANLSGAVIAPGTFVVERNVKKVQHSYGGIVSEIAVKNGDHVEAGQVLMRLDATQIRAELGIVNSQLIELAARSARLIAERDNLDKIALPESLRKESADIRSAAEGEIRLFEENRRTRESQKDQLRLRIEQLNEEITGLSAQRDAKSGELKIIQQELEQVRILHSKQLTAVSRVYAMEREEKRLGGEYGGLVAQIARAKGQISEINVQILAVDENTRAQAQRELRSIEAKLSELSEREVAVLDKLKRVDLRAPQKGVVHELAVHTVGGVVTAAEQIMLIVPEEDNLTIQARVSPNDVDQVVVGRPAKLRLSAFNQQKTPEVPGRVIQVAADVTLDPKTGQSYYMTRLEMDEKKLRAIGDLKIVPGMPVEVFMSTGERTALSYLAKPFTDQMNRAFRE
ncbi:HlyD family type I secretion periplasmic adaptor subunit [Hyphomicrobium sp.]|uniref:HlyD family type I secretion periplasmic adaptor subunit n=1 Tax=Hyphomicrobium sp. TaxID=82 RepID=UPI002E36BBC8|nr:HlyD family type I secretion periplasmic adaptor subunit [Hyphomicrobium sp.]HEX2842576.1 HlyD family type I secretion periplasmic adaptor subunit [Hyphomicrobium sp.]